MEAHVPFQRNLKVSPEVSSRVSYFWSNDHFFDSKFQVYFCRMINIYINLVWEKKKKKRYWASSYDNEFYITAKIMSDFWGKFGVMCLQQFRMSHGVQSAVVKCHHLTESVLISWCPSIIKISTASSCFSIFNTCQLFTKKLKVCSSVYGLFYQVGKTIWLSLIFNTAGISYK